MSLREIEDLRREIDGIDRDLLRLIEQRAEKALAIGKIKGSGSNAGFENFFRPSREMQILRKIFSEKKNSFPKSALLSIWREIISAVLQMQNSFSVALCKTDRSDYLLLARNQFGATTPLRTYGSVHQILAALSDHQVTLGLVPIPGSDLYGDWWLYLHPPYRVLARLPAFPNQAALEEAFLIGWAETEQTGEDRSLIVLSSSPPLSRTAIYQAFKEQDFQFTSLDMRESEGSAHHLLQIEGYVEATDNRLEALRQSLSIEIRWIGAYACPLGSQAHDTRQIQHS